ncbi:hypothetical protein [Metabacillus niabensis]|uniref:GerMN domain-containing protein n=1 Tax=Metabacillus niabensis TaxID=324854 RepID=A0ABT9YYK0_9BACI|nr:hypothetical protein [Metabacillus niabensis]MDQ0225061.1 hypothetical protein [Metabacillus niabensis]
MKKPDWNEKQIERLLNQMPLVKDKQTADEIYQSIQFKIQSRKKKKNWIAPSIATAAALFLIAILTPLILEQGAKEQKTAMDLSNSEKAKIETAVQDDGQTSEQTISNDKNEDVDHQLNQVLMEDQKETFVTKASEAEDIITVGFTNDQAELILPVSLELNDKKKKIEVIEEIKPEIYSDELGPISFELSGAEIDEEANNEEVNIDYHKNVQISGSSEETLFLNSVIETFRWDNYKKANLYTNDKQGIELSNYGVKNEVEMQKELKKAYFLYQYSEETQKLLVPSPNSYDSIEQAIDAMKTGLDHELKPTIVNHIIIKNIFEDGEQLEVEFEAGSKFEDNQEFVIMLESILLSAKEFGFKTVYFKGIDINHIGVMDVAHPIEVPFSPNPIEEH